MSNHQTNLVFRVNFMSLLYCISATYKQVPSALFCILLVGDVFMNTIHHEVCVDVDFVDCQPVLDQSLISSQDCITVSFECFQSMSGYPTIIFICQMQWAVKMIDCYQWFNTILVAFLEDIFIELQTFFIWCFIIAIWEDSCPVDGKTVNIASHFSK